MLQQLLQDARGFRSRYINALNAAVKSLTPIAGRGIRLRQSAQGTVIEAIAKSTAGGGGTPFAHRWKVTASYVAETAEEPAHWELVVAADSIWQDTGVGLTEIVPEPDGSSVVANGEDWRVPSAGSGQQLYVVEDSTGGATAGTHHYLVYGDVATEPRHVLLRVADFAVSTGGVPSVTQRAVGDQLRAGAGATLVPGPLVMESQHGTYFWRRYLGSYIKQDDGSYVFARAASIPAIESYDCATAIVAGETADTLDAMRVPQLADPTSFLSRQTATLSAGVEFTPPDDETGTGVISHKPITITYYSMTAPTPGNSETLLTTLVDETNESTTYEEA